MEIKFLTIQKSNKQISMPLWKAFYESFNVFPQAGYEREEGEMSDEDKTWCQKKKKNRIIHYGNRYFMKVKLFFHAGNKRKKR